MKSIGTYVYSDGEEYSCTYGDRYNSFYLTNSNSRTSVKSQIISSDKWNFTYSSAFPKEISCNVGEDLYVYEGEDAKTLTAKQPPNAKFLYVVFAPDMRDWHASIPMISMNGGKTLRQLKVDPYKCGWYYYMWLDEEISDNVMLVKDTDT